jgi:sec-independent protein translocase protein TatB
VGFFEIVLIAIVTLLVVGPERMPEAVRSVALTIGRLKRTFNNAREELEKHIGADDIRRQLHNEDIMASLEKTKASLSILDKKIDVDAIHEPLPDEDSVDDDEYRIAPPAQNNQHDKPQSDPHP